MKVPTGRKNESQIGATCWNSPNGRKGDDGNRFQRFFERCRDTLRREHFFPFNQVLKIWFPA